MNSCSFFGIVPPGISEPPGIMKQGIPCLYKCIGHQKMYFEPLSTNKRSSKINTSNKSTH